MVPFSFQDILDVTEPDAPVQDLSSQIHVLDPETRKKLRNLCWETMFGQELVKLTIMDLVSGYFFFFGLQEEDGPSDVN